jgi:hypothetical protein
VRRVLITMLAGAALAVGGMVTLPLAAQATSACTTGVSPAGTGGTGSVATPLGCVQAHGDAATQSGYVVADGSASNPGPAAGYIGLDSSDGGPTIVGCSNGDYNPDGYNNSTNPAPDANGDGQPDAPENNVLVSPNHLPSAPSTSDPCTPSAP